MADLKRKFLDILFEDDPSEIEEKPVEKTDDFYRPDLKPIYKEETKQQSYEEPKNDISIKASDVLYRKSNSQVNDETYRKPTSSTFINLNEPKRDPLIERIIDNDEYELSSQISPIFGVIKEEKRTVNVKDVNEKQVKKPDDWHLDIITSPIYGYGNRDDRTDNYFSGSQNDDELSLHELFDNEKYHEESYSYNKDKPEEDEEISLFKLFGDK